MAYLAVTAHEGRLSTDGASQLSSFAAAVRPMPDARPPAETAAYKARTDGVRFDKGKGLAKYLAETNMVRPHARCLRDDRPVLSDAAPLLRPHVYRPSTTRWRSCARTTTTTTSPPRPCAPSPAASSLYVSFLALSRPSP